MSEMSLVVKQASLSEMEQAMTAAHQAIVDKITTMSQQVDAAVSGWNASTTSRAAQIDYQRRLAAGVERLANALDDVRIKLAEVASDAHEAEVTNVAIVD